MLNLGSVAPTIGDGRTMSPEAEDWTVESCDSAADGAGEGDGAGAVPLLLDADTPTCGDGMPDLTGCFLSSGWVCKCLSFVAVLGVSSSILGSSSFLWLKVESLWLPAVTTTASSLV